MVNVCFSSWYDNKCRLMSRDYTKICYFCSWSLALEVSPLCCSKTFWHCCWHQFTFCIMSFTPVWSAHTHTHTHTVFIVKTRLWYSKVFHWNVSDFLVHRWAFPSEDWSRWQHTGIKIKVCIQLVCMQTC